jgi:hypothetical protein
MRTFDFAPLYRVTVGFDRMVSMLDQLGSLEGSVSSYPPYNIERASENAYRISVAVAGFTDADLSIETEENRQVPANSWRSSRPRSLPEALRPVEFWERPGLSGRFRLCARQTWARKVFTQRRTVS